MTPRYPTLLFDLDHTLFDSDASEIGAYARTMAAIGFGDGSAHFARYVGINRELWAAVERGDLLPDVLRLRRFERFVAELGIDADPGAMADTFVDGLAECGTWFDGALDVLDALRDRHALALVTNGLSAVQRRRLERLGITDRFDAIVISSEVGTSKPRPEIFNIALERLGSPPAESALMIGDSLSADIGGAIAAGIDSCWFNWRAEPTPDVPSITHEIAAIGDLLPIVA